MSDILVREIVRKSIHLSGLLILIIYHFTDRSTVVFWLSLIVVAMFLTEWMRLKGYIRYPGFLLRPFEEHKVAGYIYSTTSALFVIALFPKNVAMAAISMAIIGDLSSGIAGAIMGDRANVRQMKLPHKPVLILIIMFLMSFISAFLIVDLTGVDQLPIIALVAGAAGATIADGVPWEIRGRVLDDNLTIPFTSAILILLFSLV